MRFSKICMIGLGMAALSLSGCEKDPTDPDPTDTYPNGFKKAKYSQGYFKIFGGPGNNDDELASGMVGDASGNLYFCVNTNDASANRNVVIGKVDASGSLAWAKMWDGNYTDQSPDSGENNETGGTGGSISIDASGNIYVVMKCSDVSQNSIFSLVLLKISGSDGSLIWEKKWKHRWPASGGSVLGNMDAWGYAVEARVGDYVYVTGSDGDNKVPVVAFNKSDGSVFFQMQLDITSGTKDRGYALRADGNGNLYVGGVNGSNPYLAKIGNANTATPSLTWAKQVSLGFGSRINDMDIDGNDIYISCDRRGATTYFSVVKLDQDGNVVWGKTFPGTGGDRNNTHTVRVLGNHVYVGGRTGQQGLDTQFGDGLLVRLDKSGNLNWAGIYFTGTASDKMCEHRLKGFFLQGNDVYVMGQSYSGPGNSSVFTGDWIIKDIALESYNPGVSNLPNATFSQATTGEARAADGLYTNAGSPFVFVDAASKNNATPPDGDMFLTKVQLQN